MTGQSDTGVTPLPGVWYRFRVQAEDGIERTTIRAMAWEDGSPEPEAWQATIPPRHHDAFRSGLEAGWDGAGSGALEPLEAR